MHLQGWRDKPDAVSCGFAPLRGFLQLQDTMEVGLRAPSLVTEAHGQATALQYSPFPRWPWSQESPEPLCGSSPSF